MNLISGNVDILSLFVTWQRQNEGKIVIIVQGLKTEVYGFKMKGAKKHYRQQQTLQFTN